MRISGTFAVPALQEYIPVSVDGTLRDFYAALREQVGDLDSYLLCSRCVALYGRLEACWADFFVEGQLGMWPACDAHAAYHEGSPVYTLDGENAWAAGWYVEWEPECGDAILADEPHMVKGR